MNKLALASLLLVGCGSSLPVDQTKTDWLVTVGQWETPTCKGTMTLSPTQSRDTSKATLDGTWTCGSFGQTANAQVLPDGRAFLNLETAPGFFNGVRGTLADSDAIAGDILLDGGLVPFAAYRQ